jgi:hypothetical protein
MIMLAEKQLAVHARELADHVDQVVLFSGDGDFHSLVEALQRRGVHVTVVSTIASQPPMISDELRRQADASVPHRQLILPCVRRVTTTKSETRPVRAFYLGRS